MSWLRPPGRHTLFRWLLLAVSLSVVFTLLLSYTILSWIFAGASARQLAGTIEADARGISHWAAPSMAEGAAPEGLKEHLGWLRQMTEGRLWLLDRQGVVVADTGGPSGELTGTALAHPWVERALSGEGFRQIGPDPWIGSAVSVGWPIRDGERVVGALFLFVDQSRVGEFAGELRLRIGVTLGVATLVGLTVAWGLSRSLARPLEQLSRFAGDLGQKRFSSKVDVAGIAEFEKLGKALQVAAAHLEDAFDALAEEKQRIHSLISEMSEGVLGVDDRGDLLLINPTAGRLLGLPGPLSGPSLHSVGLPRELVDALTRAIDPLEPKASCTQVRIGGVDVQAQVTPVIGAGGRLSGAVAVLQDITAESQLRRLQEGFVANVSHELRAPLASLSAGVEAMHDGLVREEARPKYLKAMLSEIGRLRRLVDELLDLSRLEAGMAQIPLEEFDLAPLCGALAERWEPRCAAASLELEVAVPSLRVVANYDRVEEILSNFLDNAVRFTPPGGKIRLFGCPEGEMVRLGVADTGVGVEAEHLPHLWDRFYKVDRARTRTADGGTGLGLSIVKQLVEHLGGEVAVESAVGQGSVFTFTLVAARGAK